MLQWNFLLGILWRKDVQNKVKQSVLEKDIGASPVERITCNLRHHSFSRKLIGISLRGKKVSPLYNIIFVGKEVFITAQRILHRGDSGNAE